MSERMTSIVLPGVHGSGYADWGRKTPKEMIDRLRRIATEDKQTAEKILAAKDDDFLVETYLGVHARRKREILQKGKPRQ